MPGGHPRRLSNASRAVDRGGGDWLRLRCASGGALAPVLMWPATPRSGPRCRRSRTAGAGTPARSASAASRGSRVAAASVNGPEARFLAPAPSGPAPAGRVRRGHRRSAAPRSRRHAAPSRSLVEPARTQHLGQRQFQPAAGIGGGDGAFQPAQPDVAQGQGKENKKIMLYI